MIPFMLSIIMDPNIHPNPDLNKLESALEDDKYHREIKYWQTVCQWLINICIIPQSFLLLIELI